MLLRSVRGWLPGLRPGHAFRITAQSDLCRYRQSFVSIPIISQWTWSWLLSFKTLNYHISTMSSSAGNAPGVINGSEFDRLWGQSLLWPRLQLCQVETLTSQGNLQSCRTFFRSKCHIPIGILQYFWHAWTRDRQLWRIYVWRLEFTSSMVSACFGMFLQSFYISYDSLDKTLYIYYYHYYYYCYCCCYCYYYTQINVYIYIYILWKIYIYTWNIYIWYAVYMFFNGRMIYIYTYLNTHRHIHI